MTGIPAELVERAADRMSDLLTMLNVDPDEYHAEGFHQTTGQILARAALGAIGLPALLERVEAAEDLRESLAYTRDQWTRTRHQRNNAITERDALAAKVADAGERIAAAIEAAPWCLCSDSHCVQRQTYANAARIARAALTKGTEDT